MKDMFLLSLGFKINLISRQRIRLSLLKKKEIRQLKASSLDHLITFTFSFWIYLKRKKASLTFLALNWSCTSNLKSNSIILLSSVK